jgi:N-acetylmuramoyl-L-alanine amidase
VEASLGERRHLLLRPGDRSPEVADVQARLRGLGLGIDDPDGAYGLPTEQAVRAFQQRRGLLVDGVVGPDTWSELVEAGWRLGDRSLYLRQPPLRGDDVRTLQARLNALGLDAGREDGIFGRDTDRAVRAFQREYDVAEDGIFGPRSLAALNGLRVDRAGTAAGLREDLRRVESPGMRGSLVVVDPGHGGDDPGERGCAATHESDLCWDVAARVAERLSLAGARVRFTRTEAENPDVAERARRANELDAHVFISLHLNFHPEGHAEGTSTYYFGGSRAAELLAECVQSRLVELGLRDCRAHARSYPILRETRMPAVLVEPAYISSPTDAGRLGDPRFRTAISWAIVRGVQCYFDAGRA